MFSVEILFLGLALAIDAAVVSFALGLLHLEIPYGRKILRGNFIALVFGIFQFLMLWLGSYGGFILSFSTFGYLFQYVVSAIFFLIGIKFISESLVSEKRQFSWSFLSVLILGFATSIDALGAGISLGTLPQSGLIAIGVGVITSISCGLFYFMAHYLQNIPERWLLRMAGMIFFGLSLKVVWANIFPRGLL